MMPETTSMPKEWMIPIASMIGIMLFCSLCIALSATGSGVSMPQKIVQKYASHIIASRSGDFAMFKVASQASCTAKPLRFCHSMRCGSSSICG